MTTQQQDALMYIAFTLSTNNTPRVRDGLRKNGTALITKRGYLMWLKAQHEEDRWQTIATISRYTAYESPIGRYCKLMGVSAYGGPKWVRKVREYYEDKMHGLQYTAIDATYHMVELYGYKCSSIFYGTEEDDKEAIPAKLKRR